MNKRDISELTGFWSKGFHNGTLIQREDYELLKQSGKLVNNCRNFDEYISNYLDNTDPEKDTCFHPNLWPAPYCGDLKNANVFILSLNPGFGGGDYYYEKDRVFSAALRNNLSQKNLDRDYPLCYLNPKFSGTGGTQYWYTKFEPVIEQLSNRYKYTEALKIIAKKTVLLESVPYHSKSFNFSGYADLPSVKKMRDFVNNYVVPNAEQGNCLLIVLRKGVDLRKKGFSLTDNDRTIIIYKGSGECQSASLKTRDTYKRIVGFLKK